MNELNEQKNKKPETRARKFWRVVFGSMLGFFLSTVLVSFFYLIMMIGMIASLSKSSTNTTVVKDNSLLKIDLAQSISERTVSTPFDDFSGYESAIGLNDILAAIKQAGGDPKIKGIYLNLSNVAASPATLKEIHDALLQFKFYHSLFSNPNAIRFSSSLRFSIK